MLISRKSNGFTIVELLIVIVVIGILAAIVIVAYNGIQSRAIDSVVQSDLKNYTNKVLQFYAVNGRYPYPNTNSELSTLGVKFSQPTLDATRSSNNMIYCGNNSTGPGFAIVVVSKSGTRYMTSSDDTSVRTTSIAIGQSGGTICPGIDSSYGGWLWSINISGVAQI